MGSAWSSPSPSPLPPAPRIDPTKPEDYREKFNSRAAYSQFVDPCAEASKQAMKCLSEKDGDRSQCKEYFDAYNLCKKTWMNKRKEDRREGKDVP
ncbi:hypothetical protein DL96DRAFT_1582831 [Flagelloscypha sp. PMI_526]|nr:hypothetical protein DL96DRAFT_1582831 [Flagelloscypha sp. PMI_526]